MPISVSRSAVDFQGCVGAEHSQDGKDDQQMEILVDNISELAAKVLEIFGG